MAKVRKREWTTTKGVQRTAYIVDYVDNLGDRQRTHFSRYKAADRFRIKIESQLSKGIHRPDAEKVTVRNACLAYLDYAEGRMNRNERMTRKMLTVYRGHIQNYILNHELGVGKTKLSQFSAKAIGDFRDRIRDAGTTVSTSRKILATLHTILEHAISQDWVAVNTAAGVKVIGPRDEGARKITAPSKQDLNALLTAADDDLRFMLIFAASTGLRAGEQWALTWADVDFDNAMIHVRRRMDSYGEMGPPKSLAGIRDVPLSEALVRLIKEWRLQSKFSTDDDFVFPNRVGRHTSHDNLVKRRYKPTLLKEGLPGINWHSLRHFAISTWIEAGLAPKTVQTFAGHSSLQVTMDRYGHLFPSEDHKQAMDRISDTLISSRD